MTDVQAIGELLSQNPSTSRFRAGGMSANSETIRRTSRPSSGALAPDHRTPGEQGSQQIALIHVAFRQGIGPRTSTASGRR